MEHCSTLTLAAADAHRILELCLDDRAPFGLLDFFTGAAAGGARIARAALTHGAVSRAVGPGPDAPTAPAERVGA